MKGFALVLALLPLAASAATITVNSKLDNLTAGDGKCTLREAIANVDNAGDTTSGDCTAGSGTGDTIGFQLRPPTSIRLNPDLGVLGIWRPVAIVNSSDRTLRIDGQHRTGVFEIAAGITTTLHNLTLQNGVADVGGGVRVNSSATLVMEGGAVLGSSAPGRGGGIFIDVSANVTLSGCTLSGNQVGSPSCGGGAISNIGGTLTVIDSVLRQNRAIGSFCGGGAIYNNNGGVVSLTNCTLSGNRTAGQAVTGGGIYNGGINDNPATFQGTVTLSNCTLRGNKATDQVANDLSGGGGISNAGTVTLTGSTFSGNHVAGQYCAGGGIANYGTASLTNCTFSHNSSVGQGSGAAIANNDGNMTLTNCTIANNPSSRGGASIVNTGFTSATNTIVANTSTPGCVGDGVSDFGQVKSGSHNMSSDGTCFGDGFGLLNTNPHLAPLGNYGGPTQTLALCTGAGVPDTSCTAPSPAIDAGDDSVTGAPDNLTTDQRGLPRLAGAQVDIGAYEAQ